MMIMSYYELKYIPQIPAKRKSTYDISVLLHFDACMRCDMRVSCTSIENGWCEKIEHLAADRLIELENKCKQEYARSKG